jgi:hypothetical protein
MEVSCLFISHFHNTPMTRSTCARPACLFFPLLLGIFLTASLSAKAALNLPWDWSGVIGTGQSLSVGARAFDIKATNQLYGNLQLSTDHLPWPVDPADTNLSLVPLTEPIGRRSHAYPSSWPENIEAETYHTAMADEISVLVHDASGHDFTGVHSEVGENGQGMIYIKKGAVHHGINGRSYEAAMIETKAINRLAKEAGKTFGVGAIVVTHGETDAGNTNYENELRQLWSDYNTDVRHITGQKQGLQMILSQQDSVGMDYSRSTQAQWKIGADYPADIVCSGPKYQYPYYKDGIHLISDGYEQLGEKYGEVYFHRVILGDGWQPLHPIDIQRDGKTITIQFHVPNPPLACDTDLQPPHPSVEEWKNGKGFEVCTSSGAKVAIQSVEISGDSVVITCATDPGAGARMSYAMVGEKERRSVPSGGTVRWGLLRDSDPFVGAVTKTAQPNYCVAFEMTAP